MHNTATRTDRLRQHLRLFELRELLREYCGRVQAIAVSRTGSSSTASPLAKSIQATQHTRAHIHCQLRLGASTLVRVEYLVG